MYVVWQCHCFQIYNHININMVTGKPEHASVHLYVHLHTKYMYVILSATLKTYKAQHLMATMFEA